VSSSSNAREVLAAAGIDGPFEQVVDGKLGEHQDLRGKPHPTSFSSVRASSPSPPGAAVLEDALAGVEAGRAGGFGRVVGVDRIGQADELRMHGADIVASDLAELLAGP
jgi:beta-phosphoglucomutase-like phosphatase (HAD superfamily)